MKKRRGFTLIELLLSIAIIFMIAAFSMPVFVNYQTQNDIDVSASVVASSLRRAQTLAQGIEGDSAWGVKVQTGSIVLYKGASFATKDANFDETFEISDKITISGTSEFNFTKFTGTIPAATSITLANTEHNQSKTININTKGIVNY